jgi:tRNA (adenine37-N6)-methyltransferase
VELRAIGVIRSPFTEPEGMPIQPSGGAGVKGTVEVLPQYADGLQDLGGFSHIILLYQFDRNFGFDLKVVPFMDTRPRGLFSTRAPRRPNPIGFSVVSLEGITGRILHIGGVDILDETPLLDIKPYVPAFDAPQKCRTGWLENLGEKAREKRSDGRFGKNPDQPE